MLANAGRWFLQSGIQEPSGGVARYHRADFARNAAISTEITGYAVSAFVFLHARTGEAAYLDAATRAARFLTREAWRADIAIFPFEIDGPAYFFDCGIIARGLLAVHRATGDAEFLNAAIACGESMAREFIRDGVIHPILLLPEKTPLAHEPRWSREPGCFQLKSAMAWADLAEVTGRADFRAHYEFALAQALDNAPRFLPGDGFSIDDERVMDRLHAFGYFLEGLLPAIDRPECRAALIAGIAQAGELLRRIAPSFERSDAGAQILRARINAAHYGVCPIDAEAAGEEARRAARYQIASDRASIDGGFCFGQRGGALEPFQNPVSTAFCMQALDQWDAFQRGEYRPDRLGLI